MSRDKQIEETVKAMNYAQNENGNENGKCPKTLAGFAQLYAEVLTNNIYPLWHKKLCEHIDLKIDELKKKYTEGKGRDKLAEFSKYSPLSWKYTEEK